MQNKTNIESELKELGCELLTNAKMSDYTSFKIGGSCDFLVKPETIEQAQSIINIANKFSAKIYFIGNGSNILVSDKGISGIVVLFSNNFSDIYKLDDDRIFAQSGASLSRVCRYALDNSLSGLEFAWGIPATIGGAVYMNAGAYGGEFKDVVESVVFIDDKSQISTVSLEDLNFSYRHSFFTGKSYCILGATLKLHHDEKDKIKASMDDFISRRKSKQPLEYPSAGSTFKRPVGNYAGALIEQCGLKGYSVGGAQVSEKHSGFVINKKDATCKDVLNLVDYIKQTVKQKTGYELECEIKYLEG